ncbi:sigma-54 interaction domain-containing protein [Desulfofustis limnaeus]|uniref:Sigma-54 factor interaction domain-containing protein n=1 Tax=Desulfofustis limnaeus TaxID=2740163 RepID=A0ABM7W9H5_9BACT|nr:sigma-54 dependent transcriptional regulator [Desulfofustis limnaeus]BDD87640.1 hypothetical protein DPPLL_20050 [Desulfofustis limnaeus]
MSINQLIRSDAERLAANQRSLLAAMPQAVILMQADGLVEYENAKALELFDDLTTPAGDDEPQKNTVRAQLQELVASALQSGSTCVKHRFNGTQVECHIAPFNGYKGDQLYWLVIKPVDQSAQSEKHLPQDLDSVIQHKISELQEQGYLRKKLSVQPKDIIRHVEVHPSHGIMVGSSKAIYQLRETVFRIARTDATILVTGESGTGKELFVNLIHETSNRKTKPLLKINCTALNDSLLESELFGHEKGAFTGAQTRKKGKFEVVDGGTLCLDEIGDISRHMQAVLLRVLQNGEFIRVGGNTPIKSNARIIAATNVDLVEAVRQGSFRLDLFYRLSIFNITIPPLRERKEDITDLISYFTGKYSKLFDKDIYAITKSATEKLITHQWPGNVRELENVIQRAVLMSSSDVISDQDIHFDAPIASDHPSQSIASVIEQQPHTSLKDFVSACEKELILHNLEKYQGNVALAAENLHIGKTAMYEKLKRHRIVPKSIR